MVFIALSDNEFIVALRDSNMQRCHETQNWLMDIFPGRVFRCIPFTGTVEALDLRENPERLRQLSETIAERAAELAH